MHATENDDWRPCIQQFFSHDPPNVCGAPFGTYLLYLIAHMTEQGEIGRYNLSLQNILDEWRAVHTRRPSSRLVIFMQTCYSAQWLDRLLEALCKSENCGFKIALQSADGRLRPVHGHHNGGFHLLDHITRNVPGLVISTLQAANGEQPAILKSQYWQDESIEYDPSSYHFIDKGNVVGDDAHCCVGQSGLWHRLSYEQRSKQSRLVLIFIHPRMHPPKRPSWSIRCSGSWFMRFQEFSAYHRVSQSFW